MTTGDSFDDGQRNVVRWLIGPLPIVHLGQGDQVPDPRR
jgi:hypothetical protein